MELMILQASWVTKNRISNTTKNLFLEIAVFDPVSVATTGRSLNIHSDARYRFERGLDGESPDSLSGYIARFVQKICGGEISHVVSVGDGVKMATQNHI